MPYNYVLEAVQNGRELYVERLADYERPIAMNTSLLANVNRDPKKNKKGYTYNQFCFYATKKDKDLPKGRYGATALLLQKQGLFPSWALFCFSELVSGAAPEYKPDIMAFIGEDALLIDPVIVGEVVTGFLIAQESASNQIRVMNDENGNTYRIQMPKIETKIIAEEDVTLYLRGSHEAK